MKITILLQEVNNIRRRLLQPYCTMDIPSSWMSKFIGNYYNFFWPFLISHSSNSYRYFWPSRMVHRSSHLSSSPKVTTSLILNSKIVGQDTTMKLVIDPPRAPVLRLYPLRHIETRHDIPLEGPRPCDSWSQPQHQHHHTKKASTLTLIQPHGGTNTLTFGSLFRII